MTRFIFPALVGFFILYGGAAQANPLEGLIGKKHALLLFAKSRSDAGLDKQVELLRERRPDLKDRDIVVLVTEGRQDTIPAIGYTALPRGTGRQLLEVLQPQARGLTVILVGKDGSEKARWTRVVEPDDIFELIDALPVVEAVETAVN